MAERRVTFIVGANIRNFQKGMQTVSRRFKSLQRDLSRAGRNMTRMVTGPIAALATGMVGLQARTGQYANELLDLSEITGISTDALQEWHNVARVAGISSDALTNAASGLSRRMRGISEESGAAHEAAERLGLSFKDANGQLLDTDDIMSDAIARLSQMEPGLERASLAGDLFGRRWEQIAPILGVGADEIENARRQAHELGMVMDGDALRAADGFRQEWELLRDRIAASGRTLATQFLPIMRNEFIPMMERGFERVQELAERFTMLDLESQKNVVTFGLLAAAIGPTLLVLSKLAGVVAALTSPLAIKIGLLAALALAFTYVVRNAEAFEQHIKFIMNQALKHVAAGVTGIAGWLADLAAKTGQRNLALGLWQLTAAAEEMIGTIDLAEPTTEFQSFGEFFNSVKDDLMTGLANLRDRFFSFSRDAAAAISSIQAVGVEDGRLTMDFEIKPPEIEPIQGAFQKIGDLIDGLSSRWEIFKLTFEEVAGDFKELLAREMTNAVVSFGEAIGQSLAGADREWQTVFERIVMVFLDFARTIARLAALTGAMLMFVPGMQGLAAGIMAGAAALTAATSAIQAGIQQRASNRQARSMSVDDALIRSDGSVVRFHPDDNILAMKDFSKIGSSVGGQMNHGRGKVNVVIEMDSREVGRALVDLDHWKGRG
jgi:hypothetical protein